MSCEAPETGHKDWVKKQGGKTIQGPAVALSMEQHMVRKEASVLLCEAFQGHAVPEPHVFVVSPFIKVNKWTE
jgi:hypothetical protein